MCRDIQDTVHLSTAAFLTAYFNSPPAFTCTRHPYTMYLSRDCAKISRCKYTRFSLQQLLPAYHSVQLTRNVHSITRSSITRHCRALISTRKQNRADQVGCSIFRASYLQGRRPHLHRELRLNYRINLLPVASGKRSYYIVQSEDKMIGTMVYSCKANQVRSRRQHICICACMAKT